MSISSQIAAVMFCATGTAFAVNLMYGGDADGGKDPAVLTANRVTTTPAAVASYGQVDIEKARSGHFETDIRLNGTTTRVLIDTGASLLVLREGDARRAGILAQRSAYHHSLETASGRVMAAKVSVRQIEIGHVRLGNVDAYILPDDMLSTNLLGMNVLSAFGEVTIRGDRLVLDTRGR